MDREWKIDVNLTVNDIFFFLLRHTLSSWQGRLTWGLGILALIGGPVIMLTLEDNFTGIIFLIVAFMYLVVTPLSLYSNAKRQMISNSVFKNKIVFTLNDEILQIKQYTGEAKLFWTQLDKIDITRGMYLLYVNGKQAFIVPKRSVDPTDAEQVAELLIQKREELAKSAARKGKSEEEAGKGTKKEKKTKPFNDKQLLSERIKTFKQKKDQIPEEQENRKKREQKNKNGSYRNKNK